MKKRIGPKHIVIAAGIIFLVGLLVLVFGSRKDLPTTVRIGYLNITASMPLFVAEEKGFLAAENIQYEAIPIATSNQLVDGVLAGNLDLFVESSAVPVLSAEIQLPGRLKVFSVSSITKKTPFDTLLVKKGSKIKSLLNLTGKTIGVFPGSTATSLLKKFLADRGVNTSTITFVPLPPQNQLTALLAGSIDAVHVYEPTTSIALSNGNVEQLYGSVYAEMLDHNPQGVAVVSSKFIDKNPEIGRKVIRALERSMIFMREHESESRQILAKRMNLDPLVANHSVFLYMLPHQNIDALIFQRYADMLTELGELKGKINVENLLYRD